jgi:hypothetical protein
MHTMCQGGKRANARDDFEMSWAEGEPHDGARGIFARGHATADLEHGIPCGVRAGNERARRSIRGGRSGVLDVRRMAGGTHGGDRREPGE